MYVGTLEFLSLDNACIRSIFDEHRGPSPVSEKFFLSVELVNLLMNGLGTNLII